MVDAEATNPIRLEGVPRLFANGFRTGFLDIVELRIASDPMAQSVRKRYFSDFKLGTVLTFCSRV
jgi:hypothetical protein